MAVSFCAQDRSLRPLFAQREVLASDGESAMGDASMKGEGLRVGLFGIGLDTYWPQFAGLEERLKGYLAKVAGKLQRPGVEVVSLGLIDSPEKAAVAGHRFRQAD